MRFGRPLQLLAWVMVLLAAGSCTDSKKKRAAERRAEEKRPAPIPRLSSIPPGVAARARARTLARQQAKESGKLVTLLYSGNLDGEYEAQPLGGFARRATLVAEIRAKSPTLVHVDAGDSLLPRLPVVGEPPPDKAEVDRRLKLMATGLGRLKLDAFAPGENDLAIGVPKLKALAKKAGIPLVSANLKDEKGKLLFEPYRMIKSAEMQVGIFGITTFDPSDTDKLRPLGVLSDDGLDAAQSTANLLKEKGADVVVGVLHVAGGMGEGRRIARALTGVDMVVLGHAGRKIGQRMRVNREDRWMFEAGRRGRLLGKFELRVGEEGVNAYNSQFEKLDTRFVSDPAIEALVKPYIAESRRRAERKLPVGLSARAGSRGELATVEAEKWTYASSAACGSCHAKAKAQFATTPHASALATLERKGRQRDPECLTCHSTGFDRPGGTRNLATAEKHFNDVGCESCHGPSSAHMIARNKTGTTRLVPEAVCKECHTPEQSPETFDYAAAMRKVIGPGHGLPP